jgi:hypothetical protein
MLYLPVSFEVSFLRVFVALSINLISAPGTTAP